MHCPVHLAPVSALGAGANGPAPILQLRPQLVTIDENSALVEHLAQEKRRTCVNTREVSDIDRPPGLGSEIGPKLEGASSTVAGERGQDVDVRTSGLFATGNRAVEHGETNLALGTQRSAKLGEQLPMAAQILELAWSEAKATGSSAATPQGALRSRTTQGPLLDAEIHSQFLYWPHPWILQLYVRYKHK